MELGEHNVALPIFPYSKKLILHMERKHEIWMCCLKAVVNLQRWTAVIAAEETLEVQVKVGSLSEEPICH